MDREKVISGLEEIANDKWMKIHADWYVSVCSDALALLKEYKREDGCPCTHCMEWECNEVCEEYKTWKDT